MQTVQIVSGASSPFSILDMTLSAGVIISSGIKAFMIAGLDKIRNDYSLSLIDTNITLFGDTILNCGLDLDGGSLDLNGNDLNIEGSLNEKNSKVTLNGGHLKINENYFIEGSSLLVMQNPYDIVVVGGSFITSSSISESGYLTTGILILKGDFSQSGNSYSFDATGDHYVVFNGTTIQHVYFEDEGTSKFNEILISNPASIDYSKPEMVNFGTVMWNFLLGIKDAAVGNIEGIVYIFEEPMKTLEGIAYLASIINPGIEQVKFCIAMQPIMLNAACDVVEGNWNYRARILGRIAGEILFIIAGDKGANIGISLLKESGTMINISRAAKYALKYRTIDAVVAALAKGENVISVIESKLDSLIDVAGRARLSNYTILEEEYIDILDIVLSWNKRNSSSIMTDFEVSAMIKAHREGKSFDEVLRAIEGMTEAVGLAPKLANDFAVAVRKGAKYGAEFQPRVASVAVDATSSSRVGYGCNSIYQNNPSILNKALGSADEYVAFYRRTLTDAGIDELVASNPSKFVGNDINAIKMEMGKLRAAIQKTKDLAKAEGKYYNSNPLEASFESDWLVENCAEVWAVRDSILQGTKIENIVLRSVDVRTGDVKPFCKNCQKTFADFISSMN